MIIEVKNLDQPLVCCAVTSVWPSEGSPMADHLDWTWMMYQKSQKLRLAHKTSTYWFELLIRKVKNSDQPIRLQTYWLELLIRNVKNSDQPIRLLSNEPKFSLEMLVQHTRYLVKLICWQLQQLEHYYFICLLFHVNPLSLSTTSLMKLKDKEQGVRL